MNHASHPIRMHRSHRSKTNSIEPKRWAGYATAALASGFTFGLAESADATIHYSGLVNQKIAGRDRAIFHLDPAGDGFVVRHDNFVYGSSSVSNGGVAWFYIYGAVSAAVNGVSGACQDGAPCVSNLNQRDAISARPFVPMGGTLALEYDGVPQQFYGQFLNRGYGLVGFKFNNGSGDQYGWVRVRMSGGHKHMVSVVDYAYGDPGDTVLAGQTSGGFAPGLESLGGLALGAAGLLALRRKP
jgi:hypothetical protein